MKPNQVSFDQQSNCLSQIENKIHELSRLDRNVWYYLDFLNPLYLKQ